ncbi:carbon-nitrogen hydrolase family protein [Paenibacillus septentrionalis]|uniref:Carbon-nitrogen hydrolase family protein n=1 Tax=Paenibacillus septentrionalis TaxID=429342 RepID=A0ABW1V093_9BACL
MKYRVGAVQYKLEDITSFDQFAHQVEHYVRCASEFGVQMLLFPEFMTTQLLSIPDDEGNPQPFDNLPNYTEEYIELFQSLSKKYDVHIIGGTHIVKMSDGSLRNGAHYFSPKGDVKVQHKVHLTPTEVNEWGMSAGDGVEVFDTPFGKIAMLTCYDIEFPEIVRMVRAKGADVIYCPSCTDDQHGFYRVRYCCHARTVENQVYVVTTGTVGTLRNVDFMRANVGKAAILAPNDIPFPPAGVIAEGIMNDDMIIVGDIDLSLLQDVRAKGAVMTWRDRRTDLYTDWS